jgi:uncharacterized protein YndB with AHSA1/START domain
MPPVDLHVDAPPERVWEILSEPKTYEHWVVGSRSIESWDPQFPAVGSKFEHTQGKAPLIIRDITVVDRSEPPRRIELIAQARPLLVARVIVEVAMEGTGSHVTLEEIPVSGLMAPLLKTPPGRALTRTRNRESLRRVRQQAEGRNPG